METIKPTTQIQLKPITIGGKLIDPPLFLAPMAGLTNHAFRMLCREQGACGMVCTELLSSHALRYSGDKKRQLEFFDWRPELESPFAVQLFGSDPAVMAYAAQMVVDHGADIVDINMGCWVPKIARKSGAGAALLRDVCTATAVVKAVVDAVDVPVTVKIRNGWEADNPTCVEFAKAAEDCGVQAIALHARFASQRHDGDADWLWIKRVKEAVKHIPIIGNGDIHTGSDAVRMLQLTGCDGVMVGRASMGNPWVFRNIHHEIMTGEQLPPPTDREIAEMAIKHARLTMETTALHPIKAIRELRGQLLKYVSGLFDATTIRDRVSQAETLQDIEEAFGMLL